MAVYFFVHYVSDLFNGHSFVVPVSLHSFLCTIFVVKRICHLYWTPAYMTVIPTDYEDDLFGEIVNIVFC